eukprot:6193254-Pleurochrysis_carterae.AAC.2
MSTQIIIGGELVVVHRYSGLELHPPPCGGGVLFSRATPHDRVASAHADVIRSPTHRPPVSPAARGCGSGLDG